MLFLVKKIFSVAFLTVISAGFAYAQIQLGQDTARRVVPTAVPFLTITPDARSGGMGDVGVAISVDANATYWNVAKLTEVATDMGAAVSFTPWLKRLTTDMSISYITGFYRLNKRQVVSASLRYFNLGNLEFRDANAQLLQDFNPRELALDANFAMKLSDALSMGVTGRWIHSNLAGAVSSNSGTNVTATPGNTASVDLSMFYRKKTTISGINSQLAFGAVVSNVGAKITYNSTTERDFIPTNLRVGTALTLELDEFNKVMFALDFNKLLVPSPPIRDANQNIIAGKDPKRSLISGVLGSFSDAPNGFKEELREVMISTGVEYWYKDLLALRGGYFHEHLLKGNRKYFTIGTGLRYRVFGFDFAYLLPLTQGLPLADTMRFSMLFNFSTKKEKADKEPQATPVEKVN